MKGTNSQGSNSHKKQKSKLLTNSSNNFSEKYVKFTKEKLFSNTPKKVSSPTAGFISPRAGKNSKISKQKRRSDSPYANKSQKININMQIKNLNIYKYPGQNNTSTGLKKKKKLHKKTISCLNKSPQKQILGSSTMISPQRKGSKLQNSINNHLKHNKAKSQQNLRLSPSGWSSLLTNCDRAKDKKMKQGRIQEIVTKYAICNRCGYCPDKKNKNNQDTYICIENFMKRGRYLFGVCDGHGANGHYVSQFIREILPQNIQYYFLKNKNFKKNIKSNVQTSLKQAFEKTSKNLIESGIDTMFSGTTTCLLYIDNHDLFCANLGDSRAVLYSKKAPEKEQPEEWFCHQISIDHKAEDKREAQRIEINGGRVFPYRDEDGQQMGPFRIWIKDQNIPGLAMTRSFGDYIASTVGVIDEPEIIYHEITKQDKFIVIATDGLWEFISKEQVLNVVAPAFVRNDPQSAIKDLQKLAVEAWKREDQSIDDITILVIFFKYY